MVSKWCPLRLDFTLVCGCQIWWVRGVVKNNDTFLCKKLLDNRCVVGRSIIMHQEPVMWHTEVSAEVGPSLLCKIKSSQSVHQVQVLYPWPPANWRKSPTWSSLLESKFLRAQQIFFNPCRWMLFHGWVISKAPRFITSYVTFEWSRITDCHLNQILTCSNLVFLLFYS